jgi:predicted lipoprotein with Yx(FWY)xxD motif
MRLTAKTLLPTLAVSLALAACGSSNNSSGSNSSSSSASTAAATTSATTTSTTDTGGSAAQAVKTASNAKLGATVLVSSRGLTIYHLSGEGPGKFLCTSAECEAHWPPVYAPSGTHASASGAGVPGLGTVKRPDGKEQLAYRGEPLYTFAGDSAPGEANGQGIKDVGTWSAVTVSAGGNASSPAGAANSPAGGEYKY